MRDRPSSNTHPLVEDAKGVADNATSLKVVHSGSTLVRRSRGDGIRSSAFSDSEAIL